MTATRSAICRTTDRSWETSSRPMFSSRTRSASRLATCAWAEASRALIGSSAIRHDGLGRQGAGDRDPLPLPAAELVRVPLGRGRGQPDPLQQFGAAGPGGRRLPPPSSTPSAIRSPTFRRGFSDAYGSWNTICSPRSRPGRRRRPSSGHRLALELRPSRPPRHQADRGSGKRRLAAAGFADQADDLAARDRQVNPVHGAHAARGGGIPRRRRTAPAPAEPGRCLRLPRVRGTTPPPPAAGRAGRRAGVRRPLAVRPGAGGLAVGQGSKTSGMGTGSGRVRRTRARRARSAGGTGSRRHLAQRRRAAADGTSGARPASGMRQGVEQPAGVRVAGPGQQRAGAGRLGHPSRVHHVDPLGQGGHHPEVVGDDDDRQPALGAQSFQQTQNPACTVTSRAVVGSSATSSRGSAGQRDGDRDALPHAAGELARDTYRAPAPGRGCARWPAARPPA